MAAEKTAFGICGTNKCRREVYTKEAIDGMVSDVFSTSKAYAKGDYCIYNNTLYEFTTAKSAGAWSATAAVATTIGAMLKKLNDRHLVVSSLPATPNANTFYYIPE